MWFHAFEDELSHHGQLRRHQLGLQGRGVRCRMVFKGITAGQTGLTAGDGIVTIDGVDVQTVYFHELRLGAAPGVSSTFTVRRGDGMQDDRHARGAARLRGGDQWCSGPR